jgi:hypothetical protein
MTEENANTNNETTGQQTETATAEVASDGKPAGYVPRSVIAEQVTPLKKQLQEQGAELEKFRQAEESRRQKELEASQNWDALKEEYERKINELQSGMQETLNNQRRTELKTSLVASGLNPEDPRDKLVIAGVLASYDPTKEPAEFFAEFKERNQDIFEQRSQTRAASAVGSINAAGSGTDVDKLVAAYRRGDMDATLKLVEMNRAGRLSSDVAARLGITVS